MFKKYLIITLTAVTLLLSSCSAPVFNKYTWEVTAKPTMESELKYNALESDLGLLDALPDEYWETDAFDELTDEILTWLDEYLATKMIRFDKLDELAQEITEEAWEQPFYENLMTSPEQTWVGMVIQSVCRYISNAVANSPARTLTEPVFLRKEGDTEYFSTTCLQTGTSYEIWENDEQWGYSLRAL